MDIKFLILIFMALFLWACDGPDPDLWPPQKERAITFWVYGDGFHSVLVFPHEDKDYPYAHYSYAEVDWYLNQERNLCWDGCIALFTPTRGMLEKKLTQTPPVLGMIVGEVYVEKLWAFKTSKKSMQLMKRYVLGIQETPDKSFGGIKEDQLFYYDTRDSYHIFNTCNSFTVDVLEEGGLPIHSFFAITNGEIVERLDNVADWHKKRGLD